MQWNQRVRRAKARLVSPHGHGLLGAGAIAMALLAIMAMAFSTKRAATPIAPEVRGPPPLGIRPQQLKSLPPAPDQDDGSSGERG